MGYGCPNEQIRAGDSSEGLPNCRAYELVSPVEKQGGNVGVIPGQEEGPGYGVAKGDGEAVAYTNGGGVGIGSTPTGFEEYLLSRRLPTGWITGAALPRGQGHLGFVEDHVTEFNPSPDFSHFLFSAAGPFVAPPDGEHAPNMFLGGENPSSEPEWLGRPGVEAAPDPVLGKINGSLMSVAGGSPSFDPVYFTFNGTLVKEDLPRRENPVYQQELEHLEEGRYTSNNIWGFYVRENGILRSAGVLPTGVTSPWGAVPAATNQAIFTEFTPDDFDNQVSLNGSRAFFVSPDPAAVAAGLTHEPVELYVRETEGERRRTVLVSQDQLLGKVKAVDSEGKEEEYPASAPDGALGIPPLDECVYHCTSYVFASPDGKQAFFQSIDSLVADAPANGLPKEYDFEVDTGRLTYLPGIAGEAPLGAQGPEEDGARLLASATDGSRFLFEKIEHEQPVALEIWSRVEGEPGGEVKMITPLPGPERGRTTTEGCEHMACVDPARATADGSVFVFETDSPIHPNSGAFNNGGAFKQVYRYTVEHEGAPAVLSCVSCPPGGVTPSGDARLSEDDSQGGNDTAVGEGSLIGSRGLAAEGGMVFFDTPDPLVTQDTNHKRDVYEWEEGRVHLISSGTGQGESFFLDNSESGNDVFFATQDGLVESDADGSFDVYDARVDGGFAGASAPTVCSGDACQGALGVPSPIVAGIGGTGTFAGGTNVAPPAPPKPPSRAQQFAKALRACRSMRGAKRRSRCEAQARKRYRSSGKAQKTRARGK